MSHARFVLRALPVALLSSLSAPALAGGLDLPSIAASHQGTSNANSAEAADASVIYYNPAGMAMLRGINVTNNLSIFTLRGKVVADEQRTTRTPPPSESGPGAQGEPIGPSGDAGSFWPKVLGAGSLFATVPLHRLNFDGLKAIPNYEDITLGIGIFAPGGGNINYKSDWAGRHFADAVAIELINVNPSMSIRFDDKHSLGFGVSVIGGHLRQKVQIDVPGVAPYLLEPIAGDFCGGSVAGIPNGILNQLVNNITGPGSPGGVLNPALEPVLSATNSIVDAIENITNDVGLCGSLLTETELSGLTRDLVSEPLASTLIDPNASGSGMVEMYGYGFGYNLGYMFNFDESSRLSIAYRSKSTLKMRGDLEWDIQNVRSQIDNVGGLNLFPSPDGQSSTLPEVLANFYRPDTTAKADLIVPARLSLGYFKSLNEKIDLMFDYTFIQTSEIKELKVRFLDRTDPNGGRIVQGPGSIQTNWRDSFKASVGANYHYNDKITLRTGFQYDMTPVPSAQFRHPAAPDSDRYMFSFGANYKARKNLTFDAAYSLIMLADSRSEYRDPCRAIFRENDDGSLTSTNPGDCTSNGGTFVGQFKDTYINYFSFQFNQKF